MSRAISQLPPWFVGGHLAPSPLDLVRPRVSCRLLEALASIRQDYLPQPSSLATIAAGHGIALASFGVSLGLALVVAPAFNDAPVPLFLLGVLASAWLGGRWAGLLATALSAAALASLFDLSRAAPRSTVQDTVFDLVLFVGVACLISALMAHLRMVNQQLAAARTDAEAAVRAREEFLSAAAHDLKSPLTGISLTAQLASRELRRLEVSAAGSASLRQQLQDVDSHARRMAGVLDELLDLAQLDAGRALKLDRQPMRLLSVVESVAEAHRARTSQHALRVVGTADPVGIWDAGRLHRVLDNLVSNAIKYSPSGGEVTLEVLVEAGDGGGRAGWATVRVRDQGLGIPSADMERIFERFFRAQNVGCIAGTGIGLAGARHIVEQHGGTLTAHSIEGLETTFVVRLPL